MIYAITHSYPVQRINKDKIDEVQRLDFSWFLLEAIIGLVNGSEKIKGCDKQIEANQQKLETGGNKDLSIKDIELNTKKLTVQQHKAKIPIIPLWIKQQII